MCPVLTSLLCAAPTSTRATRPAAGRGPAAMSVSPASFCCSLREVMLMPDPTLDRFVCRLWQFTAVVLVVLLLGALVL